MEDKLNPRIAELEIGTRVTRKIKVYPLSAGQELEVLDIVTVIVNSMEEMKKDQALKDMEVFEIFSAIIKEKSALIIGFVTDPEDNVSLNDFDNSQFADFVHALIEANFGEAIKKKLQEIQKKVETLFLSAKSLPKSSEKPVTD